MRGPHNIWRLIRTGATFERTGAMKMALEAVDAPAPVRFAARVLGWPFKWLGLKGDPAQPPMLRAITALGPAYIKFGQLMSTRPDVVGAEMARELQVLQDKIAPFPMAEARAEIEYALGAPVEQIFSEFSEPVAAASIAQVHHARLQDTGQDVAVKILRPGIERAFRKDIDAFHFAAQMIELLSPSSRRLHPTEVINHFESVVKGELDLRMEASAADQFHANTEGDEGFRVPRVVWQHSARSVMTLEWVEGIGLSNVEALRSAGYNLPALGARIVQVFLSHALRDGFFHADMHQGNLKVGPDGDLVALDFGIMGQIDEYTRRVYAEILIGFIRKDYRRVAEVHFEAGYVPAHQDVEAFALALRAVGEPIFGQDATKISMARLLGHLFDVTERFGMETRTELILLQRTMVVVEGVGRSLDPSLNIWEVAKPVVETYITDNLGPKAIVRDLGRTMRTLSRFGPQLPQLVENALLRTAAPPETRRPVSRWRQMAWFVLGGAFVAILVAALD
ncbi:2-polyprenylphenol 6-hydroxylase [Neptunicoccus cionae]|uniref:2-polyprenylphenol 6-hydroxylase n=1 Tax=Neptunicoccus cionae TaxID=2035344 RepID=UPI000C77C719|nr:2-polyprenylphenol 6-hydroxylase [Amylibacter cionae]PLS20066.1 2-polyprenylphenol 6-hydroxylase [Amylibacter cionae]